MNKYRVLEASSHADYDYILVTPTGEEINGGIGLGNKTKMEIQADMLNQETAPLHAKIAALEARNVALEQQNEAILSSLTPLLSEMAEFGVSRQFHAIKLGQLMKWTETALRITQLAKLAALEDVDIDAIANKIFAKIDNEDKPQA